MKTMIHYGLLFISRSVNMLLKNTLGNGVEEKKDEEKVIAIAKGVLVISMTVARKCLMCTYVP